MKKLICTLTVLLLLLGCLTIPAAAGEDIAVTEVVPYKEDYATMVLDATLSEDLQVLTMNGETYHRMDLTNFELYHNYGSELTLSDSQKEQIKTSEIWYDDQLLTAQVTLSYRDGFEASMYFVLDSRRSEVGLVDERMVVGQVFYRIFPLSTFGSLN